MNDIRPAYHFDFMYYYTTTPITTTMAALFFFILLLLLLLLYNKRDLKTGPPAKFIADGGASVASMGAVSMLF